MFPLAWVIFLLSVFGMPSSTTLIEKRMKQPQPSSSRGPNSSPQRDNIESPPPGSFQCEGDITLSRKSVVKTLRTACSNLPSAVRFGYSDHYQQPYIPPFPIILIRKEDDYTVRKAFIHSHEHLPQYAERISSVHIEFYQDNWKPSRCIPKSVTIEIPTLKKTRTSIKSCYENPLRPLKPPINTFFRHPSFKCNGVEFKTEDINKAIRTAMKEKIIKGLGLFRSSSDYPISFRDRLFINEDDLWMFPILEGGDVYREGDDLGDYRIVLLKYGKLAGVVYKRSGDQKWDQRKQLDLEMEYSLCEINANR